MQGIIFDIISCSKIKSNYIGIEISIKFYERFVNLKRIKLIDI